MSDGARPGPARDCRGAPQSVRREVGHERGSFQALLEVGEHVLRRVEEPQTQAGMLLLVPVGGFAQPVFRYGCNAMGGFTRR